MVMNLENFGVDGAGYDETETEPPSSTKPPSARLLAAFAIACLTAAPVSHATIGDSFTGGGLSFLRTASFESSRQSLSSPGKSGCMGALRLRGSCCGWLSAGGEVAGCESLARSHLVLRMHPAHFSSAVHIPAFFGRPLRSLAGSAGADRPSLGGISCPRPTR
jgi:hypothetical protein